MIVAARSFGRRKREGESGNTSGFHIKGEGKNQCRAECAEGRKERERK